MDAEAFRGDACMADDMDYRCSEERMGHRLRNRLEYCALDALMSARCVAIEPAGRGMDRHRREVMITVNARLEIALWTATAALESLSDLLVVIHCCNIYRNICSRLPVAMVCNAANQCKYDAASFLRTGSEFTWVIQRMSVGIL